MVVQGLFLFYEAPSRYKKSRKAYTILSCVILALSLLGTVVDLVRIEGILVGTRGPPGMALLSMTQGSSWITILGAVCISFGNFLGDALLLYRCYVLWDTRRWVLIIPSLLFIGFTGTGIAFLVYTSPELPSNIGLASSWYLLSALLNLSVTGLIVGRLIASRRRVVGSVPHADPKMYSGTISILIESALPFCVVSVITAIFSLPCLDLPATANYFTTLWVALSSFCPQLIIYRVACGRSFTSLADVDSSASMLEFSTRQPSRATNRDSTTPFPPRARLSRINSSFGSDDFDFTEVESTETANEKRDQRPSTETAASKPES